MHTYIVFVLMVKVYTNPEVLILHMINNGDATKKPILGQWYYKSFKIKI
jgi:hypothetical protein